MNMSYDSNKRRSYLVKIAVAGVMAALIFAATQIRIPIPTGYLNLGDVMINICSFILVHWLRSPPHWVLP